jgi:hypothetical protein
METIDLQFHETGQDVVYRHTFSTGPHKMKIDIRSNPYKFQCHAFIDLWNGYEWKRVFSIDPGAMKTPEGLVYLPNRTGISMKHFVADNNRLLAVAASILDIDYSGEQHG